MPTVFKNVLASGLDIAPTTVFTTQAGVKTTVVGLSLTNTTGSIVLASILLNDTATTTQAYYIQNTVIPPNQSLRVVNNGERLVLGELTQIIISTNVDNSIDLVLSYVEIS